MSTLQRRYAYLQTEDSPKWIVEDFMFKVFADVLQLPVPCWDQYDCTAGHFPDDDALRSYAGVVITGSHYNVSDTTLPWLPSLFELIRKMDALPKLRVVAICFGAQAVAAALGGEVGGNPCGFVYRREIVTLAAPAFAFLRSSTLNLVDKELALLASHGEQVTRLPSKAKLLGWSPGSPNEIFVAGSHENMFCCQAHPEFEPELFIQKISGTLVDKGIITAEEAKTADQILKTNPIDSQKLRSVLRVWLSTC
mmetsp:Transcript_14064/g.30538  ORF Transcript_14064/g.30538 Transcript_14064/m.30538 type:complete len:252 (-) Transcript_14064:160-915(-)|eukprot:CAMPEP_0183353966 /NCGR_PEP_ID=MMETSP0164_2-20130417/36100_1 /TAXON_ID=221442 /ORGANISM="Coccolithus pelagicus ssp braarudi, Strain PLY182g" /LENGTH=251 /DNA_ID=CAMNT_0025526765 /DNA_START=124 /DNA_END=879 /DNA_ORIENTATION=+